MCDVLIDDQTINGVLTFTGAPVRKKRLFQPKKVETFEETKIDTCHAINFYRGVTGAMFSLEIKRSDIGLEFIDSPPPQDMTPEMDEALCAERSVRVKEIDEGLAALGKVKTAMEKEYPILEYIKLLNIDYMNQQDGKFDAEPAKYVFHPHLNIQ